MGIATTKKSILNLRVIILLMGLILTGIAMRSYSPAHKLDSRPYYSYDQAVIYLQGLSELQKQNYFKAEMLDFWFMINYTWLLLLAFKKYVINKKNYWPAFVPGILDLFETLLITSYLYMGEFNWAHQLLPVFSTLKWLSAILIPLYIGKTLFLRRANR